MASIATSPRNSTSTSKKERDDDFKVDVKRFGEILKSLVQVFNSLVSLNTALSRAGKGSYLEFPDPAHPGSVVPFTRKDLRRANSQFGKSIMLLKNYLRVSKKKSREPVAPESFSGVFTPVAAAPALQKFFTEGAQGFGFASPKQALANPKNPGSSLMEQLTLVQQGYLLRNTITMLFYIYAHQKQLQDSNNAQYASADDVMVRAFGGNVPAAFYAYRGGDGKIVKLPMDEAQSQGLVKTPVNTFKIISDIFIPGTKDKRGQKGDFAPKSFNTYFYQNIASLNYYSKTYIPANVATVMGQANIREQMLKEHQLVKQVSSEWNDILEPSRKQQRDTKKKTKSTKRV